MNPIPNDHFARNRTAQRAVFGRAGALTVVLAVGGLSACSGGGGDDDEDDTEVFDADATGVWKGTDALDGGASMAVTVVIDANGRFAVLSGQSYMFGNGSTSGNTFAASATGWAQQGTTFGNGSASGTFSLSGDVFEQNSVDAAYSGAGSSGSISVNYDVSLSDRASSMAVVAGNYTTPGGSTLTIDNGVISYQVPNDPGCSGNGTIQTHSTTQAVYSWSITTSGCSSVGNGTTTGVAYFLDAASGTNNNLEMLGSFAGSVPFISVVTR